MKIAVAVSGGMDSLLALLRLKEAGHDVMAMHAFFLPPGPAEKEIAAGLDAICHKLDLPFHALDLHKEFDDRVIRPFILDYQEGRTPNPCALCNPRMKFGVLFDAAVALGAEKVGTGHYVRLEERGAFGDMLVRGDDASKDQSYFLSLVPLARLRRAVFPLADVYKKDVLALLDENGMTPPVPRESQEICFVPDDDYQQFLRQRAKMSGGGDIVLSTGQKVGRHKGLWRHTQGQRRGLGVAWKEPLYVLDKDVRTNKLIVGTKQELASDGCIAGQVNLMAEPEAWPETVMVQTRYRQKAKPGSVTLSGGKLHFSFGEPHARPTPGQVAAVYTGDGMLLGGGIIEA